MDAILIDVKATVPEERVAGFYRAFGQWLAQPTAAPPEQLPWPDGLARLPQPAARPPRTRSGAWVWAVDPQWRLPTPAEAELRQCRFNVPPNASAQGWRCQQRPVAVKLAGLNGSYYRLYCGAHTRHYGRVVVDGQVWAWLWVR